MFKCFKNLAALLIIAILSFGDSLLTEHQGRSYPYPVAFYQFSTSQVDVDGCHYEWGIIELEIPLRALLFENSGAFFSNSVAILLKYQSSVFFSIKEFLSQIHIPLLEISLKEHP